MTWLREPPAKRMSASEERDPVPSFVPSPPALLCRNLLVGGELKRSSPSTGSCALEPSSLRLRTTLPRSRLRWAPAAPPGRGWPRRPPRRTRHRRESRISHEGAKVDVRGRRLRRTGSRGRTRPHLLQQTWLARRGPRPPRGVGRESRARSSRTSRQDGDRRGGDAGHRRLHRPPRQAAWGRLPRRLACAPAHGGRSQGRRVPARDSAARAERRPVMGFRFPSRGRRKRRTVVAARTDAGTR